jgi:hypothetical protein
VKALLLLALAPGCAWHDGEPMGTLTGTFEARWTQLDDRDAGDGWQRLASDYEVRVDAATAALGALTLVDVGEAALNFDPADPPPGYSLCHNGHCHADDGRLVPYEEISAELGGAAPAPVVTFAIGERDLVDAATVELDCGGPCELRRSDVGRVDLEVLGLALGGLVRDTRDPPRLAGEVAWTLDFAPAEPQVVLGRIDLPIDRGHDPDITLAAELLLTAKLLDGVDFTAPDTASFPEALAETELALDAERTDR